MRSPCTATKSNPHLPQFKKVCMEQGRPSTTKKSVEKKKNSELIWIDHKRTWREQRGNHLCCLLPLQILDSLMSEEVSNVPKLSTLGSAGPDSLPSGTGSRRNGLSLSWGFLSPSHGESPESPGSFPVIFRSPRVGTSPLVTVTHQAPSERSCIPPHVHCPSAPSGGKYCCLPSGPCGCAVCHFENQAWPCP